MSDSPLVSVCLITYNHAPYIRQAIDSVLMQKFDGSWEFIIADDFSTDGTREVVLEYQQKHPDYIRLILQPRNVGPADNWLDLLNAAEGEYIAYLEGDDFWIDPLKLQKQVAILEANPDCAYCYTNAYIMRNNDISSKELMLSPDTPLKHSFGYLLQSGKTAPSPTSVYRRDALPAPWPDWIKSVYNGDLAFQGLVGLKGNFFFLSEVTAAYRVHAASKINSNRNPIAVSENFLQLMDRFSELMGNKYQKEINFHRADHLEYLAFEELKKREWKNFFLLLTKSLRHDFFRGIPTLRRGFNRLRGSIKTLYSQQSSMN